VVLKILVVEDMKVTYDLMLLQFEQNLSIENFEFTNVSTIPFALDALEQDWDAIVMDYYLGLQFGERGGSRFEHGAHLVAYRRALEVQAEPAKKKAYIIAYSGSDERNNDMIKAGAACAFLKFDPEGISESLGALAKY
jgi:CheY-like chemotaxis protein